MQQFVRTPLASGSQDSVTCDKLHSLSNILWYVNEFVRLTVKFT